jgi:membrane-bound lytic murein transglycosylase B
VRFLRQIAATSLLASAIVPNAALAQYRPDDAALVSHPYAPHVAEAARRFGIPEAWIWALMRVESNGDSRAVSRAGAMGLMQIMPGTWVGLRAQHGLGTDPFDVRDNIMAGAAYLRAMYDRYGDPTAMLAAYNAGPGRYDEYLRGRPLPAETRAYLVRLASITGDRGDVSIAAAPLLADRHAWRRGAVFVRISNAADLGDKGQYTDVTAAEEPSPEPPNGGRATDASTVVAPPPSAPTNPLFVPRAGAGRPQ